MRCRTRRVVKTIPYSQVRTMPWAVLVVTHSKIQSYLNNHPSLTMKEVRNEEAQTVTFTISGPPSGVNKIVNYLKIFERYADV
jgi:hypothetical protein